MFLSLQKRNLYKVSFILLVLYKLFFFSQKESSILQRFVSKLIINEAYTHKRLQSIMVRK